MNAALSTRFLRSSSFTHCSVNTGSIVGCWSAGNADHRQPRYVEGSEYEHDHEGHRIHEGTTHERARSLALRFDNRWNDAADAGADPEVAQRRSGPTQLPSVITISDRFHCERFTESSPRPICTSIGAGCFESLEDMVESSEMSDAAQERRLSPKPSKHCFRGLGDVDATTYTAKTGRTTADVSRQINSAVSKHSST